MKMPKVRGFRVIAPHPGMLGNGGNPVPCGACQGTGIAQFQYLQNEAALIRFAQRRPLS